MKHQRSPKNRPQSLDQRLAADPALLDRLHQIADMREQLLSQGCSLDEIESRVIEQMRLLGEELLTGSAQIIANHAADKALKKDPSTHRDSKKK